MRIGTTLSLENAERRRLEAIVADRDTPQKHVWRCRIVLFSADGVGTNGIMAAKGTAKTAVWRWQKRFTAEGIDALLRDKTRPRGKALIPAEQAAEVVRLTSAPPPHEATHRTAQVMARRMGLAVSTVQTIWKTHGLAPQRFRAIKLSNDPALVEKLEPIVGFYVDPPADAAVLSLDEKSQIQHPQQADAPSPTEPMSGDIGRALDRTQPGLPMKKGRGATMTHDYKRHGTTALFAALNVLDGTVVGQNMQRHRHQELIRFLNALERDIPAGKVVHVILDNDAAHKTTEVQRWLAQHPRWTFPFTPISGFPAPVF